MLKTIIIRTAIFLTCASILTGIASADTKVKIRQTSGGQTYENTTYIKGKRQRSESSGGQMITIEQCELRRKIQIMPQTRAYIIQPYDDSTATSSGHSPSAATMSQPSARIKGGVVTSIVVTKDTGERKQMFGYTARHIITTMEMKSSPDACSQVNNRIEIDGWYIDATFALDCDSSNRQYTATRPHASSGGCRDRHETKQIGAARKGFAVWEKMTMITNGAPAFSSINEVVDISQATLEQSLFEIPEGYREVQDFASAFSATYGMQGSADSSMPSAAPATNVPGTASQPGTAATTELGPKRAGVIRIGVVTVKPGNVAEGMNANDLALGVQNTLTQNLQSATVEVVVIDGSQGGIQAEAKQKDCDYLVFANVSHKKGGGGFGSMLGNTASMIGSNIGYGTGTAAVVAANTATNVIIAATVAQNIKAKDEVTIDVRLERPGSTVSTFAKQYKGKAKSAGEDIITPLIQQAAQAMLAATKQ